MISLLLGGRVSVSDPKTTLPAAVVDEPEVGEQAVPFLNREISWLEFNRRVLNEAEDAGNPLLERLRFIAIFDSNLDEFFMKRVGGLKQQLASNIRELSADGRTPRQQLAEVDSVVRPML